MKRLNILVSSTRQWNPGDEFIRKGVIRLLNGLIGPHQNWLLWNRNPDLFMNRWTDSRMRPDFLTNSMRDPALDLVDLVVFAGTPEWTGPAVERIYRSLLTQPQVPVLALGVGSGGQMPELANHEIEVLDRDNVFITTRNPDLALSINSQLTSTKAIPLPCPALYCVEEAAKRPNRHHVGVIVQSSGTVNQNIGEELVQDLLAALRAANGCLDLDIVSFYIDEHMRYSRLNLGHSNVYSYEPDHLLSYLTDYSLVISTRLHGAIAALSAGVPAILLAEENNFRLRSTQQLFGDLLPIMNVADAFRTAKQKIWDLDDRSRVIRKFRAEQFVCLSTQVGMFLDKVGINSNWTNDSLLNAA